MKKFVVVEGPLDAAIIRTLIEAAQIEVADILIGGGKSAATSLAKSIALSKGTHVAVVVDADTTERRTLLEQQRIFKDLQGPAASYTRLFLAVPNLEEDLFPDFDAFVGMFKVVLTKRQRDVFKKDKKRIISSCISNEGRKHPIIKSFGNLDVQTVRNGFGHPWLKEMFDFLQD